MKRIALIGNMNNNLSSLYRYLIDDGYDADLFMLENEPTHFHPSSDSFNEIFQKENPKIVSWGNPLNILSSNVKDTIDVLSNYDFIICCGPSAAFIAKAKIRIDIFLPYGSDIYTLPFIQFAKNPIIFFKRIIFAFYQKKGIKNARLIICEKQANKVEKRIQKLNLGLKRIKKSIPIIHLPTYFDLERKAEGKLKYYPEYKKLREKYSVLIFHPVRHSWKNPTDRLETKGNNFLFEGFAMFKKLYPTIKACIITIEYGAEVVESKALSYQLGIEKDVYWFPLQSRKEIMGGIYQSDIVVGELKDSFNLYGVVIEAIAMSKPILHSRVDSDFENDYPSLYSSMFANSPELVSERLSDYINNPQYFKSLSRQNISWYQKNIVDNFLHHVYSLINNSSGRSS